MTEMDTLDFFVAKVSDDEVKTDLELCCDRCGAVICDIEHGDTLRVLVSMTQDHACGSR